VALELMQGQNDAYALLRRSDAISNR